MQLDPRQAFTHRHKLAVTLAVVLASVMTCIGLSALAGGPATSAALAHLSWWFLPATLAAHVMAYASYVVGHHQVANRSASTSVGWGRGARLVVIGFGAWLIRGGFVIDRHALEWHGSTSAEASTSTMVLGLLEVALLAPAAWFCAVLLLGSPGVPDSDTVPWVIGVPLGFLIAIMIAVVGLRTRAHVKVGRLAHLRSELVLGLADTWALLRRPARGSLAAAAIAAYWAADVAALWAALQFVSITISLPRLIVGYSTGYLLTRRSLPFAGAIVIEALMALSLNSVGVPLAAAAIAVLVYRLSDFTFTLGGALLASSALEQTLSTLTVSPDDQRDNSASTFP